jgi:hypothetical protein
MSYVCVVLAHYRASVITGNVLQVTLAVGLLNVTALAGARAGGLNAAIGPADPARYRGMTTEWLNPS